MGNRDSLPVTDPPKGGVNAVDYHRRDDSLSGSLNTMTSQGSTMKMDDSASPSSPYSTEAAPLKGEEQGCIKRGDGLKIIIVSTIVFAIAITIALIVQIYTGAPQVPPHGGVSCSVPECSEIGIKILQLEGSAVDAAIAMMFCVGLFNPHQSGLGGGGFMLIHNRHKDTTDILDFREVAPIRINKNADFVTFQEGVSSVAVPGELSGMVKAYEKFGSKKLSWKDLLISSIEHARYGIRTTEGLAKALTDLSVTSVPKKFADIFSFDGKWRSVNITYTRPDLASTFEKLKENPLDHFYRDSIAKEILEVVGVSAGGTMSEDDLRMYNVTSRNPISTTFKDYNIITVPAPTNGPILLALMNILEPYVMNLTVNPFVGNISSTALWYHYIVEAMKFAYGQLRNLGDPDKSVKVKALMEEMINKTWANNMFEQIDPMKPLEANRYTSQYVVTATHGTEQISVIDNNDLYVSVSSSINGVFGSKLMTNGGIILNSHMQDFSNPNDQTGSEYNYPEGGKRPISSMTPAIFYHKSRICGKRVAIGGKGGVRITSGIAQLLLNLALTKDKEVTDNNHIADIMESFRIHSTPSTNSVVEMEDSDGNSTEIAAALTSMGHTVKVVPKGRINAVNLVMKINEDLYPIGDKRAGGSGEKY